MDTTDTSQDSSTVKSSKAQYIDLFKQPPHDGRPTAPHTMHAVVDVALTSLAHFATAPW